MTSIRGSSRRRIVFFIRDFNDIDHSTPIIDRLCQESKYIVEVYCQNWHYDLVNDYNINYLKNKYNLNVTYLWGGPGSSLKEATIVGLIDTVRELIARCRNTTLWRLNRYFRTLELSLFRLLDLGKVFSPEIPHALIFDWSNADAAPRVKLIKHAKELRVPTICLPHSILVYSNPVIQGDTKSFNKSIRKAHRYYYDYYLCHGLYRHYLVDRGVPDERILEIGSARFCREWIEIYQSEVVTELFTFGKIDTYKIAFFLSPEKYNVFPGSVEATVKALAKLPNSSIVLVPHTRGMVSNSKYLEHIKGDTNVIIATGIPSSSIIDWADVVIVYASSIATQALCVNKNLMYLAYIDSNQTFFADMGACVKVDSAEDLKSMLISLRNSNGKSPYSEAAVNEFLSTLVYAGDFQKDVIENYCKVIRHAHAR